MTEPQPEVSQETLIEAMKLISVNPVFTAVQARFDEMNVIAVAKALYARDQEIAALKAELEAATRFKPIALPTHQARQLYQEVTARNQPVHPIDKDLQDEAGKMIHLLHERGSVYFENVNRVAYALAERDQRIHSFASELLDCQDQLASARAMLAEQQQRTADAWAKVAELEDRLSAAESSTPKPTFRIGERVAPEYLLQEATAKPETFLAKIVKIEVVDYVEYITFEYPSGVRKTMPAAAIVSFDAEE